MPEGPSIIILKGAVQAFKGKKIIGVTGNSKLDIQRLHNQTIRDFKSWGKHFLICFDLFTLRIHFMLFGTYRINEAKQTPPRLGLIFKKGELNFYACSIQFIEGNLDEVYDWSADVLNPSFNAKAAKKKLLAAPDTYVCDALLNQNIFAGSGNIIKNEVLFRIHVHPLSTTGALPPKQLKQLVAEAVNYSHDFLHWKRAFVLKQHWLAHTKKTCPRCNIPLMKQYLGKTNRRSYFCINCQLLYQ